MARGDLSQTHHAFVGLSCHIGNRGNNIHKCHHLYKWTDIHNRHHKWWWSRRRWRLRRRWWSARLLGQQWRTQERVSTFFNRFRLIFAQEEQLIAATDKRTKTLDNGRETLSKTASCKRTRTDAGRTKKLATLQNRVE